MLKVVILTNNSLRHIYFANIINKNFSLVGIISEPPNDYFIKQREESDKIQKHFELLKEYEKKYLGEYSKFPFCNTKIINKKEINNKENIDWVKELNPDYILLYGTGILNKEWTDETFKDKIINIHLGLSPYYRGSATLFWPFVNDELEYIGTTIHLTTQSVDGGDIIYNMFPELEEGDNYYDINYKTIKQSIDKYPFIINQYSKNKLKLIKQKKEEQKYLYKRKDFTEDILVNVLDKYGKGLTNKDIKEIYERRKLINS